MFKKSIFLPEEGRPLVQPQPLGALFRHRRDGHHDAQEEPGISNLSQGQPHSPALQ